MNDFEIYSLFFVYDENLLDGSAGKERPCLVVKSNYLDKELFYPITSTKRDKHYEIRDWKQAGLTKPSYLIYDKYRDLQAIGTPKFTYVGKLSDYDIQRIKSERLLSESVRKSYSQIVESFKVKLNEEWAVNGSLEDFNPEDLVNKAFENKRAVNRIVEFKNILLYINVDPGFTFGQRVGKDEVSVLVVEKEKNSNAQNKIYEESASDKESAIQLLVDWKDDYMNDSDKESDESEDDEEILNSDEINVDDIVDDSEVEIE